MELFKRGIPQAAGAREQRGRLPNPAHEQKRLETCTSKSNRIAVIMMFLLVVVVDNQKLEESFMFRDLHRCNYFAHLIESGKTEFKDRYRGQANITAYCIPKYGSKNIKTWD